LDPTQHVFNPYTTAEDVEPWLEMNLPERQYLLASPAEFGLPEEPE
jgi:hypothetical protein